MMLFITYNMYIYIYMCVCIYIWVYKMGRQDEGKVKDFFPGDAITDI